MLTKFEMELRIDPTNTFSSQKAVLLQSILMEQANIAYAEKMHTPELHPYSQSVVKENDKYIWIVNTLNKEAYEELIVPLEQRNFQSFHLNHNDCKVEIVSKKKKQISKNTLIDEIYFSKTEPYIRLRFRTPVSFKSDKRYVFYPDIRLMYQSLLYKYEAASVDETIYSDELLEQLVDNTQIIRYQLKSCKYNIGKAAISSFVGNVTLKTGGPQSIINFAHLLFQFGEYSGLGIKSAMGMGNIEVVKGENV